MPTTTNDIDTWNCIYFVLKPKGYEEVALADVRWYFRC